MVVAVAKIRSPGPTTRKRRARLWLPLMAAGRTQKVSGRPQPQQPTSWKLAKYDDLPQIGKFLTVHGLLFDMGDGLHEFRHQSTARRAGRKRRIPYTTSQRPPPRRGQDCPHPPDHELAAVLLTANETVGEHRGPAFEPPFSPSTWNNTPGKPHPASSWAGSTHPNTVSPRPKPSCSARQGLGWLLSCLPVPFVNRPSRVESRHSPDRNASPWPSMPAPKRPTWTGARTTVGIRDRRNGGGALPAAHLGPPASRAADTSAARSRRPEFSGS